MTAVAVMSVDRFGRRPLLLLGVSVMVSDSAPLSVLKITRDLALRGLHVYLYMTCCHGTLSSMSCRIISCHQSISLLLLALAYVLPVPLPALSVTALLLYVGCYQVSFSRLNM